MACTHSNVSLSTSQILITSAGPQFRLCRFCLSRRRSTTSSARPSKSSFPAPRPPLHQSHDPPYMRPHAPTLQSSTSSGMDVDDGDAAYTSMKYDPLGFWDSYSGLLQSDTRPHNIDHDRNHLEVQGEGANMLLDAQLRLLASAASDRVEMHSNLARQRDNWNMLFQRMLTSATLTACVLGSMNGQAHSLSLALPALLINASSAAMMAIINQFQPSQLAEEQRTAARLFRKLASDIHFALHVAPHLSENRPLFYCSCRGRLQALDKAFPMPLTPGGLEKFPAKVVPPVLVEPESTALNKQAAMQLVSTEAERGNNGWDESLTEELQRVAALLDHSDIPKYAGWAQNLMVVNKCLAIAAPLLATCAALLNGVAISTTSQSSLAGMWAGMCSALAAFVNCFSNDMQLGMVYELYRNSAGYYLDVRMSIEETLRIPIEHRENGALFRQRIMYQLGQCLSTDSAASSGVPLDAKEAGTLF